jgi:hypothetical protein
VTERSPEAEADLQVSADNLRHFGEPVYEYEMSQGIDDGYLAACEIVRRDIFLDDKPTTERQTGVQRADLIEKWIVDADTGELRAFRFKDSGISAYTRPASALRLAHRARTAFLALSLRSSGVNASFLAGPPLRPPLRPNATASGFLRGRLGSDVGVCFFMRL